MTSGSSPRGLQQVVLALLLVVGVVGLLVVGRTFLLPLCVAGLLAVMLDPIRAWVVRHHGPNWLGVSLATAVPIALLALFVVGMGDQTLRFVEKWPAIRAEVERGLVDLRQELPSGVATQLPDLPSTEDAGAGDDERESEDAAQSISSLRDVLAELAQGATAVFLSLVYMVLFLVHQRRIRAFLARQLGPESPVVDAIDEGGAVVRGYLRGRALVVGILSAMYSAGFALAGLEHAVVVGPIVGLMSIIPFLGNLVGGAVALALALAGDASGGVAAGVLITMVVGQLLENYVLTPLVVGSEVSLNAMAVIIGVVALSLVWGPVGAVVAIPLLALVREVLTRVEGLEAWAELLSVEEPS